MQVRKGGPKAPQSLTKNEVIPSLILQSSADSDQAYQARAEQQGAGWNGRLSKRYRTTIGRGERGSAVIEGYVEQFAIRARDSGGKMLFQEPVSVIKPSENVLAALGLVVAVVAGPLNETRKLVELPRVMACK